MARDVEQAGRKQAHLKRETVVQAALNLLNDVGLEGLTMRRLADHLGVQVAALYWHFKNKQELLNAMADAMIADWGRDLPDDEDWAHRLQAGVQDLRRCLLAYRDGARVLADTYVAEENTLRCAEILCEILVQSGCPPASIFNAGWTMLYYVIGLTIEEQAFHTSVDSAYQRILAAALPSPQYPMLSMFQPYLENYDFDARFNYGLNLIIEGLRQESNKSMKEDGSAEQ
ncbi:TetR family transcriptional regulator [Reticulibacter mediterranei]|uniref:TetR family transcriptional regulator n=1 Tax=Reticulibacter mediterranei TaxID=2778369 RepID=A0A8J3IVT9_9CHLR|nr:TetR/AcrR family transcriptional regulator C-terminal domain-containing protein [Reticulibacter mediterranei]GHO99425.1 TetR family transcriptional regulator [Reticulibacter mediterranei]